MAKIWRRKKVSKIEDIKSEDIEIYEPDISQVMLGPAIERIAYGRLWKVGLAAAGLAAVANLFIYTTAIFAGIPLLVPAESGPSGEMMQMPVSSVILNSALPAVGATLLLAFFGNPFFRGRLPRPTRILEGLAFFIWLFSLAGPLSLPVSNEAKVVMVLMHTMAAVVIVGVLMLFGRAK